MKLLITGGCGFIGSNYVHYLMKKHPSYHIVNVDKLTYAGNLENLKSLEKKKTYRFVKADICNTSQMQKVFDRTAPDAVVNFAAESFVDRSIAAPSLFLRTNFLGVGVLLNCALRHGVKKFLHISTDEVYGSILRGKFKEDTRLDPSSPYSASKAAADGLVMSYHRTYDLPVLITRSSNNYGPHQFPEKFIPLVILNALAGRKIPLYGDGLNVRDWIYVEDNCRAIDTVLHRGRPGEIYNIGGQCERTNMRVVKNILQILGKPASLITHIQDRPGHDRRYALSIAKMQKELTWRPRISFTEGLKKTIAWYLDNPDWLKNTQTGAYRRFYRTYYTSLGLADA